MKIKNHNMKNLPNFEEFLNESKGINDPVLMWARASKPQWDAEKELNRLRGGSTAPKNRLYGKQRKKYEDLLADAEDQSYYLRQELRDLKSEYKDTMEDMEVEAGQIQQKGGEIDDAFGNKYGEELNKIKSEIDLKLSEIEKIQVKIDKWQDMLDR